MKTQVQYLPVRRIRVPGPRRTSDAEEQQWLTDSVALYGVLQPISVRAKDGAWELMDGQKRLQAARAAGMETVPCLVSDTQAEELLQVLQRKDLHYLEQAQRLARFMESRHMSQQAAADLLGLSQSQLANLLRLLRHPPQVQQLLRQTGLSQRHARALLACPEDTRAALALQAAGEGWSAAQLERKLCPPRPPLLQTLEQMLSRLGITGLRQETDTHVVFTIRIPKPA